MDRPRWAPPAVDLERPSAARIYDYLLGGMHNFAADRQMAEQLLSVEPGLRRAAHANRAFLWRAVRYLASAGIRQFLDLGSGLPTVGSVHEAVQQVAPCARVVYVDVDPVAVAHGRAIVADNERVTMLAGDIRDIDAAVAATEFRAQLDLTQPIAVLLVAVLHYIPDSAEATRLVARVRDAVAPGSYLAISHVTEPRLKLLDEQRAVAQHYLRVNPVTLRSREEIAAFFTGLEMVEPGLVYPAAWRAEADADSGQLVAYAAVGRKP